MNVIKKFEIEKDLKPGEAAKMIGVSYSLWKQMKSEHKSIQLYIRYSIEALCNLPMTTFNKLRNERLPENKIEL